MTSGAWPWPSRDRSGLLSGEPQSGKGGTVARPCRDFRSGGRMSADLRGGSGSGSSDQPASSPRPADAPRPASQPAAGAPRPADAPGPAPQPVNHMDSAEASGLRHPMREASGDEARTSSPMRRAAAPGTGRGPEVPGQSPDSMTRPVNHMDSADARRLRHPMPESWKAAAQDQQAFSPDAMRNETAGPLPAPQRDSRLAGGQGDSERTHPSRERIMHASWTQPDGEVTHLVTDGTRTAEWHTDPRLSKLDGTPARHSDPAALSYLRTGDRVVGIPVVGAKD